MDDQASGRTFVVRVVARLAARPGHELMRSFVKPRGLDRDADAGSSLPAAKVATYVDREARLISITHAAP